MIKIFFGLTLKLCQAILSYLPITKKNHFILGCSSGNTINGNAKALFHFTMKHRISLDCHLFLRNRALVHSMKLKYPDNVHYSYSIKALKLLLKAKTLVITHGIYDLAPFICTTKNHSLVNIWHGFPIKKLGIDSNSLTDQQRSKALGNFDGLVTMSEEERVIMSRAYKTKLANVWVTGYPRNDEVFKTQPELIKKHPYLDQKRIILYAPTFRDNGKTNLFPFEDFNLDLFDQFLDRMNTMILLRVHKNELDKHNLKETNNIKICDSSIIPEINDILQNVSILITDYSSIYIDILLINKPMIFIPYDFNSFSKIRGFSFDYHKVTPGPKVDKMTDLMTHIKQYLDNPNLDQSERAAMRDRFHLHQDNENSRRVYEKIEQLHTNA